MTELTPFAIYLIFTADNLRTVFVLTSFAGLLFGIGTLVFAADEDIPEAVVWGKRLVMIGAFSVVLAATIPSTKTLVAMYGIPAAIEGAKTAAQSEVGQKAYSAVNKLLDGYLSDKSK